MADTSVPSGFGGIVRYNEEYTSRFMISPAHVVGFAIVIMLFVIALNIFW